MEISIDFQNLTKCEHTKTHFRRLKPTCAKSCVLARNPLGHVVFYAPMLACRLRLALHHIGRCRFARYGFLKRLGKHDKMAERIF